MTKLKSGSKPFGITTVVLYVFLVAAIGTYFLPFVGVGIPVVGEKSWGVRDLVKTLPKGVQMKGAERKEFTPEFDFVDLIEEVTFRIPEGKVTWNTVKHFLLAALIPVALLLAYLALLIGLFLASLKNTKAFACVAGLATVCAAYVVIGISYLGIAAQKALADSLARVEESPFFLVTKELVQEVSIRPDIGGIALLILAALIFVVALFRSSAPSS